MQIYETQILEILKFHLDRERELTPEIITLVDKGIQNCTFVNHLPKTTSKLNLKFVKSFYDHFQALYYLYKDLENE